MSLIKYLKKWRAWDSEFKRIFIETFFFSIRNEIFLKLGIFKQIRHLHNLDGKEDTIQEFDLREEKYISFVMKSINILEKRAIWKPECYNQALTAKQILDKRNIFGNIHIGFKKLKGEFEGHAWVSYKGKIIVGFLKDLGTFHELKPASKHKG